MTKNTTPTKMTKAERIQAAIDAGFWFAKDHGRWNVGYGSGSNVTLVSRDHTSKTEARDAMVSAWETSCSPVSP